MDLTDVLIGGGGFGTDKIVGLDDLRVTLSSVKARLADKKKRLAVLLKENMSLLKAFDENSRNLCKSWILYEKSLAATDNMVLPTIEKPAFNVPEPLSKEQFTEKIVRERVLAIVRQLATSKEFDPVAVSLPHGQVLVTKKAARLLKLLPEDRPSLRAEAITLFLELSLSSYRGEIQMLPSLSALYHNDCQCLGGGDWPAKGSAVLNAQIAKQSKELRDTLENVDGDEDYTVERAVAQALLRISQIGKVWAPLLDKNLFSSAMLSFEGVVLEWFWSHLQSLQYITDPVIQQCKRLAQSIVRSQPAETSDSLTPLRSRIKLFVAAMDMSLMQLCNSYRRGVFDGVMSRECLCSLVEAMFEESSSRDAVLQELSFV